MLFDRRYRLTLMPPPANLFVKHQRASSLRSPPMNLASGHGQLSFLSSSNVLDGFFVKAGGEESREPDLRVMVLNALGWSIK